MHIRTTFMCITHLDGSRRSRSRSRGRRASSSSSSGSGVHGSAQRLKQGLKFQRCAPGQPQIVDIPARTLQIQCLRSPVRASFHTHSSSQCVSVTEVGGWVGGGGGEREREIERERERDKERATLREKEIYIEK